MNRTREQAKSPLLQKVWSIRSLERAWQVIQDNSRTSKSQDVKREVDDFRENAAQNLRSISSRLSAGSFQFLPAKGVPIPKRDADGKAIPGKFRPIVLANIESRIVQRSILEALIEIPELQKYVHTPNSFGGVRKRSKEDISAVPAAIAATLQSIGDGSNFLVSADIEKFFTRIPKSKILPIISSAANDPDFLKLFEKAIAVELSNMASLKEKADAFPIYDVGVAQGNSLSPLLGNILLFDFDAEMNAGDCRCIRYIDDVLILGPSKKAVKARFKLASKHLTKFGMLFSESKTLSEPISVNSPFEFLGIELNNGIIRPSSKAQKKFFSSLEKNFVESKKSFREIRSGKPPKKEQSVVSTLRRIDGILLGWGKHYRFCNDKILMQNIDVRVSEIIREYLGEYGKSVSQLDIIRRRQVLGVELLQTIKQTPLTWPKKANIKRIDNPAT